jgi:hypothetical protein
MGQHYPRSLMYCSAHIGTYSTDVRYAYRLARLTKPIGSLAQPIA